MNYSVEPYEIYKLLGKEQLFTIWYTKINGVDCIEARLDNLVILSTEWPDDFDWIEFEKNIENAYEELINM